MSHLSLEELELIDEPKYRNYISSVDKALKNFEYTSEWADLISALGKLNKVRLLQRFAQINWYTHRYSCMYLTKINYLHVLKIHC